MSIARLLKPDLLAGAAGGLLAYLASNLGFYYGGSRLVGMPPRSLMPDHVIFLLIDLYVGAGSGYAGYRMGQELAGLVGANDRATGGIQALVALMLGTAIALVVNLVLTAFNLI